MAFVCVPDYALSLNSGSLNIMSQDNAMNQHWLVFFVKVSAANWTEKGLLRNKCHNDEIEFCVDRVPYSNIKYASNVLTFELASAFVLYLTLLVEERCRRCLLNDRLRCGGCHMDVQQCQAKHRWTTIVSKEERKWDNLVPQEE